MDGLKKFFRTLKRVHFWILCPLVVVMGLAGWFMTIGTLKKQKEKNVSDINSKYSATTTIRGTETHPNQKVHDAMDDLLDVRRGEVASAWQEKWDQQTKEGGVLTWPDFGWKEKRRKEFMDRVRDLRPIEKKVDFPLPPEQEIPIKMRRSYRDYIKDELPNLAKMIGAVWVPQERRRGGTVNRGPNARKLSEAKVAWSPENQQELQESLFDWGSRTTAGEGVPTLLQILYAQEDLWVLRAVMQVIDRANEGATARFNAAVKEIEWLRIGSKAIWSQGRITRVGGADQPAGGEMGPDMRAGNPEAAYREGAMNPEGMMAEFSEGGPAMGMVAQIDPSIGRYVDKDYKALEGGKLREVVNSESVAPEEAYLVVAKRIPVRMRLKVDQRKLHKLLVECANSELTIEVREVRINPDGPRAQSTRTEGSRQLNANRNAAEATFSYDVTVEIYGIVYIYSPVDRSVLGYEDEEGPEESSEPAEGDEPVDEGDVA